jgi:hypothetical protein
MMSPRGDIAAITGADSASVQSLLTAAVGGWRRSGARVVGLLAESHGIPDRNCGAGVLRDIVSGMPFPMYFETPPAGTSCHLDPSGLETAGGNLLDQIAGSDLVVLSKFGKLEATGAGLVAAFEAAIGAGIPILTSVSDKHREAWERFAPGATGLTADEAAIQAWWRAHAGAGRAAGARQIKGLALGAKG